MKKITFFMATAILWSGNAFSDIGDLQGVWRPVEMFENGQKLDIDGSMMELTVIDNEYLIRIGDTISRLTMRTSGSNRLNLVARDGVNAGTRFRGLYERDGNILTIGYVGYDSRAPKSLTDVMTAGRLVKWTLVQGVPQETYNSSIGLVFRRINPGTLVLGASPSEPARADEVQRRVTISRPFLISDSEVTVGQFKKFVEETKHNPGKGGISTVQVGVNAHDPKGSWQDPGFEQTDDHPVVFVSWSDANQFAEWLSKKENRKYRLPTEAEWEYAARAGTRTAYWWGDSISGGKGKANVADRTYAQDFRGREAGVQFSDGFVFTAPVRSYSSNANGLYDVHGNVYEWVADYWSVPLKRSWVDPTGPEMGDQRMAKGGGFASRPDHIRSAFRFRDAPDLRFAGLGFRLVLDHNVDKSAN